MLFPHQRILGNTTKISIKIEVKFVILISFAVETTIF